MIRKSLQDLIVECRKFKVIYNLASYEFHDYEEGSYADFTLRKIDSLEKLAAATQGYEVKLFALNGQILVRILENYSEE